MSRKKNAAKAKELPWKINIESTVAVYIQIENQIRFAMSAGKLHARDQLPSVRALSEKLKINPNTVSKAYRDLEVMGYLYTRRGMGVYIKEGAPSRAKGAVDAYVNQRVGEIAREAGAAGLALDGLLNNFRRNLKQGEREAVYG